MYKAVPQSARGMVISSSSALGTSAAPAMGSAAAAIPMAASHEESETFHVLAKIHLEDAGSFAMLVEPCQLPYSAFGLPCYFQS